MKKNLLAVALLVLTVGVFTSCEKIDPPVISNVEIGSNNSKTAFAGGDLHLEAEIVAEGKIANIRLVIHPEEAGEVHAPGMKISQVAGTTEAWEVDSIYTGVYANVKNTTFHEHIEVSANAEAGHYHLHLYVTDLEGNQTIFEEEVLIEAMTNDSGQM